MSRRGMTLVELMIGTAILVGGGGALLVGMQYAMIHSDYLSDFQIAMDATQSRLEELVSTNFTTLATDTRYNAARTTAGQCMGLNEDRNCDGVLNGTEDLNGNGQLDEPIPGARLSVRIRNPDGTVPDANSTVLELHVAACWTSRGRGIGEDLNCDGTLDGGEDANGNGLLDSPAMATTRVAVRDT